MTTKEKLLVIPFFLSIVMFMDYLGYLLWRTSMQTPPDAFHLGIITESIINLFI